MRGAVSAIIGMVAVGVFFWGAPLQWMTENPLSQRILFEPLAGEAAPPAVIDTLRKTVRTGDLVFRAGRSQISRAVRMADSGTPFTHVGLAVLDYDSLYIIHAVPGEAGVVQEAISSYLATASAVKVRRPVDPDAGTLGLGAAEIARGYIGRPFGFDVSGGGTGETYCTHMIRDIYRFLGVDLTPAGGSGPRLRGRETILPSDLMGEDTEVVFAHQWNGSSP